MGSLVQGTLGAFGAYTKGHAAAQAANYNAQIAIQNAKQQKQNATIASQSGAQQVAMQGLKTRAAVGSEIANQAASGVNVHSGSALDTQVSSHEIGMLDALQIRGNATREAFGYQVKAANEEAQSNLDKYAAKSDELGAVVDASSTFLSSVEDSAKQMMKIQMAGGL